MTMIARLSGLVEKGKNSLILKSVIDKKKSSDNQPEELAEENNKIKTSLTKYGKKYKDDLFETIDNHIKNIGNAESPDETDSYYYLRDAVTFCEILMNKNKRLTIDTLEEIKDHIISNEKYQNF